MSRFRTLETGNGTGGDGSFFQIETNSLHQSPICSRLCHPHLFCLLAFVLQSSSLCIYIYMYIYICLSLSLSLSLSLYVCIYIYIYISTHICIPMHVYIYIYRERYIYIYVYTSRSKTVTCTGHVSRGPGGGRAGQCPDSASNCLRPSRKRRSKKIGI